MIYKETKGTLFKSSSPGSPLAVHLLKLKSTFKNVFHNKPKRDSELNNIGLNRIDSPREIRKKKKALYNYKWKRTNYWCFNSEQNAQLVGGEKGLKNTSVKDKGETYRLSFLK